jgi:diguanylate cyclase (GGDEF)-like protein
MAALPRPPARSPKLRSLHSRSDSAPVYPGASAVTVIGKVLRGVTRLTFGSIGKCLLAWLVLRMRVGVGSLRSRRVSMGGAIVEDPSSDDRAVDATNNAIEGQPEKTALDAQAREDDQARADREQALADADQTGSDNDQTAAGRDQAAADSDQAASDRDLAAGGDPEAHRRSREARDRSAQQRQYSAQARLETAASRDQVARARDRAASAGEPAAELRDRERAINDPDSPGVREHVRQAADDRRRAAADRAAAARARARAAVDREQAARDREQATRERLQAQTDRDELLRQLAVAQTDGLTGTRARATGLEAVDQEVDRAHRTMAPLVVAYIDVVGLKAVNDAHGHAAGDALLQRAVQAMRAHLRSYDLIVRIGGDEFLCVMSGASVDDAHQRFNVIQAALAADPEGCEIKVGFAALAAEDSAAELIRRADADLPPGSQR